LGRALFSQTAVQLGPWSGCGESLNIPDHSYFFMPPVGFEPTTFGLKVRCSTS
jgi:hypothetical protein